MRRLLCLGVLALVVTTGCAGPSLVRDMKARESTYLNTTKIVVRDSEGSFGGDIIISESSHWFIQRIWDTIYQSRPYSLWSASGFREVSFYSSENSTTPTVVLRLNDTDEAHFQDKGPHDGYRCPGLFEYLTPFLKREYEKKHPAASPNSQDKRGK